MNIIYCNQNLSYIKSSQWINAVGYWGLGLGLWCLTPLSTIFQLYRGNSSSAFWCFPCATYTLPRLPRALDTISFSSLKKTNHLYALDKILNISCIGDLSRFWLFCLSPLVFSPNTFKLFYFPIFRFWSYLIWRLFKKRAVCTKCKQLQDINFKTEQTFHQIGEKRYSC
jgi:hypothetical protein